MNGMYEANGKRWTPNSPGSLRQVTLFSVFRTNRDFAKRETFIFSKTRVFFVILTMKVVKLSEPTVTPWEPVVHDKFHAIQLEIGGVEIRPKVDSFFLIPICFSSYISTGHVDFERDCTQLPVRSLALKRVAAILDSSTLLMIEITTILSFRRNIPSSFRENTVNN